MKPPNKRTLIALSLTVVTITCGYFYGVSKTKLTVRWQYDESRGSTGWLWNGTGADLHGVSLWGKKKVAIVDHGFSAGKDDRWEVLGAFTSSGYAISFNLPKGKYAQIVTFTSSAQEFEELRLGPSSSSDAKKYDKVRSDIAPGFIPGKQEIASESEVAGQDQARIPRRFSR